MVTMSRVMTRADLICISLREILVIVFATLLKNPLRAKIQINFADYQLSDPDHVTADSGDTFLIGCCKISPSGPALFTLTS